MPTNLPATWDNGRMSATTTEGVSLRHVVVVGGTAAEWALTPADQWADRLSELCKVADHAGATRAIAGLQAGGTPITEATISAALNAPAAADPDLVVVVGAKHRMPPSLVWELAYSELVFLDTTWQHFGPGHLDEAIGSYAHRHRRFGGID